MPFLIMSVLFVLFSDAWWGTQFVRAEPPSNTLPESCRQLESLRKQLQAESAGLMVQGRTLRPEEQKRLDDIGLYTTALDALCPVPLPVVLHNRSSREWINALKHPDYMVRLKAAATLADEHPTSTSGTIRADLKALTATLLEVQEKDSDGYVRHYAEQALKLLKEAVASTGLP